ncbi:MAG: 50S ribosomal protein L30 [Candidatus Bathyarchaeia archaeon]|nr:50S ribosomal protein L30 [Candidatus Bathyarchaeia archaeon]
MTKKAEERKCFAVVKVRGTISAQREARETLDMLRLAKTNNCVLVDNRPSYMGMLYRVQNYVTWGEVSKETVVLLLKERGRLAGGKKLTDETIEKLGYKSIHALADAIASCKVEFQKLPNVQPVFKLRPPTKGFKGKTKKSFRAGGEAGYRGEKISELIKHMA